MSIRSFITTPIMMLSLCVLAQELRIGGGYSMSNVSRSGEESWMGRAGYQFGLDVQIGDLWFLRGGTHFQVRNLGFSSTTSDSLGPGIVAQDYTYTERDLRVPIMLGRNLIRASDDPPLNVYAMAGPAALFPLSTRLTNDELDVEARSPQWFATFGGGVTLGFFFVEGSYGVAMSDVFQGHAFRTNPKVNQFCINAGLRLALVQ